MYSLTENAFLTKETWSAISRNHYNSDTPILSRVKKKYDLQGTKDHVAVPLGAAGGVGGLQNGYLPEGGSESGDQMEIIAKDHVVQAVIDRKSMKAAMTDRGAFVRFTQRPVEKAVESYDTSANLLWHGDGTGKLGTTHTTGYVSGGAVNPIITFSTAFFERWFPKNFQVNFGNSGSTGTEDGVFKIVSVDIANRRVTFLRQTGTFDLSSGTNADSRNVYLQNMFNAAPMGLEGTLIPTSGDIYSITYDSTSWGSLLYDAGGAPPSVSMLNSQFNQQCTRVDRGDLPDFILTSNEIWAILSDIWEPSKRIMLMPRDGKLTQDLGFGIAGLAYTTPEGKTIPIVADKHCLKDRMYGLYSEVMYMHHMPDQGWWDDDGKVFLRVPNRPWYAGTYGGFYENVIHPTFQIVFDNVGI